MELGNNILTNLNLKPFGANVDGIRRFFSLPTVCRIPAGDRSRSQRVGSQAYHCHHFRKFAGNETCLKSQSKLAKMVHFSLPEPFRSSIIWEISSTRPEKRISLCVAAVPRRTDRSVTAPTRHVVFKRRKRYRPRRNNRLAGTTFVIAKKNELRPFPFSTGVSA